MSTLNRNSARTTVGAICLAYVTVEHSPYCSWEGHFAAKNKSEPLMCVYDAHRGGRVTKIERDALQSAKKARVRIIRTPRTYNTHTGPPRAGFHCAVQYIGSVRRS